VKAVVKFERQIVWLLQPLPSSMLFPESPIEVDSEFKYFLRYIIDQGSPYPLATLNPFSRELLLLDVFIGFKWSTWIQKIL
jgi:hypothetical protein